MLPVHGFVLAGGKSSRMGRDKALIELHGHPLVEIAVEKLRTFCATVSIAGNREDLSRFAPVVREARLDVGPAAGIEAGLGAAEQAWAMFMPVDVPLVPAKVLQRWALEVEQVAKGDSLVASHLSAGTNQPAFCMVRRDRLGLWSAALDRGERSLAHLLHSVEGKDGFHKVHEVSELYAEDCPTRVLLERWFTNVNTPEELADVAPWSVGAPARE